jgi:hypothetical protein
MVTEKALVAEIDYGFLSIEGLCHPSEGYGVGVAQANRFLNFVTNPTHAVRSVKRLLGEDVKISQWNVDYTKTKVKVLNLRTFARLCVVLTRKNNETAYAFVLAAIEETHERRFAHAFGQKIEEEEWNDRLALRMKRVLARKDWTDVLMERFVDLYHKKPCPNDYRAWTTEVNWHLFNRPHFNSDRDTMTLEQQETILDFERMAKRLARKHPSYSPNQIIQLALDTF